MCIVSEGEGVGCTTMRGPGGGAAVRFVSAPTLFKFGDAKTGKLGNICDDLDTIPPEWRSITGVGADRPAGAAPPLDAPPVMFVDCDIVDEGLTEPGIEPPMPIDWLMAGPTDGVTGVGFIIEPMPGIIEVMDSKFRPSSVSTERYVFRRDLQAEVRR